MTPGGRKRSQRAIVVVGNGDGVAGFAVGKAQTGISALKKVCSNNLLPFWRQLVRMFVAWLIQTCSPPPDRERHFQKLFCFGIFTL